MLQQLHQQILAADPALAFRASAVPRVPRPGVPRQPPARPPATLDSLGYIALRGSRPDQAVRYCSLARASYHDAGHAYGEADAPDSHTAHGDHNAARRTSQQALALYQAQHHTTDATRIQQKLAALRRGILPGEPVDQANPHDGRSSQA